MKQWVDIGFDCLPLRSVGELKVPDDASPKYRARCERIIAAIEKHGALNTYYLYNAHCTYRLTNDEEVGMLQFRLEGTVFTDADDQHCVRSDLDVELVRETCSWLTEPVVKWFEQSIAESIVVEFNRYIQAGDLDKAKQRIEQLQATSDEAGGFVGMYL